VGGALAGYAVTRLSARRSSPLLPVLACVAIGLELLAHILHPDRMPEAAGAALEVVF
jgi:hypothetical protein